MNIGVAQFTQPSEFSIESLFNAEIECRIVQDEFTSKFKELDTTLKLLDNILQIKHVQDTYRSYEAQSVLYDLFGRQLTYSVEGTISNIWERIKQFCLWVWNGIKKLFGSAEKKMKNIKDAVAKKRSKSKDGDNIGRVITIKMVDQKTYETTVQTINKMIAALKETVPDGTTGTDFKKIKGRAYSSEDKFNAIVDKIRSDMNNKVVLKLTKWSQVDSAIGTTDERVKQMSAFCEQLSSVLKQMNNFVDSVKQDSGDEAKVKYAAEYTRYVKSALQVINGVTGTLTADISGVARGGTTETDLKDVATGGEKK